MRVRFFSPEDEQESANYLALVAAVDRFWKEFRRVQARSGFEWLDELRTTLRQLHPALGLELECARDGTKTLYVLPTEGAEERPLAALCVERAPERLPWLFDTGRPRWELDAALESVQRDFGVHLKDARARVGIGRGHLIDVVLASHEFHGADDERGLDAAAELLSRLIGDRVFDDWVGRVSVQSAPRPGPLRVVGTSRGELPLSVAELADAVEAAGRGILAGLSERPCHLFCERAEWYLFEMGDLLRVSDVQPQASGWGTTDIDAHFADGMPHADLLSATTMCPEMLKSFLSGAPFASQRFSRHGERFCYLKLRVAGESADERVKERTRLEDSLNRALVPGRLGCVVGAGLGSEYAYVHLALTQVDAAVALTRRRLREAGAEPSSWLLFCDDEWRNEWVSIWEGQGPPPAR